MKNVKHRTAEAYVCPVCFRHPNECICNYYSMNLILIDEKLQYAIQKLNDANIFTIDCCEGHFEDKVPNTYISFSNDEKLYDVPKEFVLEIGNVIRHIYKNTKSKNEFKKEQKEVIENLNEWVNEKTGSR